MCLPAMQPLCKLCSVLFAGLWLSPVASIGFQRNHAARFLRLQTKEHGGVQVYATQTSECGPAPTYPNAKPKKFEDAKATFYNTTSKKTEPVTFQSGDTIEFECVPGYTTDGAKDGAMTLKAECVEHGYYKPDGVCMQASTCGPVPNISHAAPTGMSKGNTMEFACAQGYSLDGEKVIADGLGRNRFFQLKCIEHSGSYEDFVGECKPYAFMPAKETIRLYNKVSEALFVVSCKGSLTAAFGKGAAPSGIDKVCSSFEESSAACQGLVTKIKGTFESELKARESYDKSTKKEWHEEGGVDRPGIGDEAQSFCVDLWKLLEMPDL